MTSKPYIFVKWVLLLTCSIIVCGPDNTFVDAYGDKSGLTLQLVQLIFRHGDRNPINPYPTDPYKNESLWPEGFGQLTKLGKQQQFLLGQYLRQRYDGFLSEDYSPHEIYVQSSDVDRTIMSAQCNLAGLYPPVDKNNVSIWNENLLWQPIPVHTIPGQMDNKLRLWKAPCPRYDVLWKQFQSSETMQEVNEENKDLYEYLTNHSGRTIHDPEQVGYLYDVLLVEQIHNRTLPLWAQQLVNNDSRLSNLTALSYKTITYTTEMKRLKGGPLIKELIEHMRDRKTAGTAGSLDSRRKLFMYSGHDTTLGVLLNSLDVFEMKPSPYASLILIELLKNETANQYFVRLGFKNRTTTEEPYILTIPGCEPLCPFDDFVEISRPIIPDDWNAECTASTGGLAHFLGDSFIGWIFGAMLS